MLRCRSDKYNNNKPCRSTLICTRREQVKSSERERERGARAREQKKNKTKTNLRRSRCFFAVADSRCWPRPSEEETGFAARSPGLSNLDKRQKSSFSLPAVAALRCLGRCLNQRSEAATTTTTITGATGKATAPTPMPASTSLRCRLFIFNTRRVWRKKRSSVGGGNVCSSLSLPPARRVAPTLVCTPYAVACVGC